MSKKRLVFIDLMKSISMILIMINHMPLGDGLRDQIMVGFNVDMGVPFFMIVSGFTYTMSMERKRIDSIPSWFEKENFKPKLDRIVPFFALGEAILLIWTLLLCAAGRYEIGERMIELVTHGGYGPGSYYFFMLLQIAFVFPFMIWLLKKNYKWGSAAILGFNVFFELSVRTFGMDVDLYRMLMFRYLGFIWAGITLYYYKDQIKFKHVMGPFVVGFVYIFALRFTEYDPAIVQHWVDTSFMTVGYAFMFVFVAMKAMEKIALHSSVTNFLKTFGNATYHIYVVQMVYYYMRIGRLADEHLGIFFGTIVSCTVCSIIGVWCFKAEEKLRHEGITAKVLLERTKEIFNNDNRINY